ncbi:unnamed protein product [Rotaria sp. Silwood2]|nr:unnamed protein product [Rotaria sp. Silwood2]CAF2508848.1 unnamed protein product [Rotaria sp. Silwood2]CAF2714023.1 unnamed protein product [Rotaria sp. Silwood2]CAF2864918.1 unnamed protein product [Rotaria sp. Silwood2]CAF3860256.1 unnamed protein product [Rotaria sp. Silwood2]
MASHFTQNINTPIGHIESSIPVPENESYISHSKNTNEQNSLTTPFFLQRPSILSELDSSRPSLIVHINKSDIASTLLNDYTYQTEVYLQQRDKQNINKTSSLSSSSSSSLPSSSTTKTTWKNLKYQKEISKNDQAEIDHALSRIDSIHEIFNRSSSMPYNQVYSSLYGDNNKSDHLMKTFCQCQNHFRKEEDNNHIQQISNSVVTFEDTDSDLDYNEDEEEKKKTYDSGYDSVLPRRHISRESLAKFSQNFK